MNQKLSFTGLLLVAMAFALPATTPCKYAYVLKITGLKMNPPVWTDSGNPQ